MNAPLPLPYDGTGRPSLLHWPRGSRLPAGVTPTMCHRDAADWELAGRPADVTCGRCRLNATGRDAPERPLAPVPAVGKGITPTPAEKGRMTRMARRASTGFRKGDRVRTNAPRSPRFHRRLGVVVDPCNLDEVGLTFRLDADLGVATGVAAWFLPGELDRCE